MKKKYPRNMLGYGLNPPKVNWPKKARIAVQFVLNYEEGGENTIGLRTDYDMILL